MAKGFGSDFPPRGVSPSGMFVSGKNNVAGSHRKRGGRRESEGRRGIKKVAFRLNNTRSSGLECSRWRRNYVQSNVMVVTHFSPTRSGSVEWWE
ncbi:hypothetical protein NPIL_230521 [Nephila pilipes]|uniref:Uncharacterized protein n=1 Tax=Nephila pilipes TaxID=299642 RepID=A0A8X6U592_NEPPI|nr:hypothetical protein NPIL_230521 [Nephila pilipes]